MTTDACAQSSDVRYCRVFRSGDAARGGSRRARQSCYGTQGRALPRARARLPTTEAGWLALPAALDAYLKDHFGLREKLITAHRELTKPMLGFGNNSVLVGRDGRMVYLGENAVRQSAGLLVRDERVAETAATLQRMNEELHARGVRFLVAMPPNGSTIYQDDLPQWARNPGKPTEYDLLLAKLAAKGVPTADLRPAIKKARAEGSVFYMHDTHWTFRGALAGYNAIVEADAHPDWRIEPSSALGPMTLRKGGDLARMSGVGDAVSEYEQYLTLPPGKKVLQSSDPFGDFIETSEKAGPTIFILATPSPAVISPRWFYSTPTAWFGWTTCLATSTGRRWKTIILTRSGGCPPSAFWFARRA